MAVLVLSISCKKDDASDPLKIVVLEGYPFATEPVDDIRWTVLLPYGGEDTIPQPINDANVNIIWNGVSYPLMPSGGDSGYYYYPGSALQILEGEIYKIEIDYFNKLASGVTVVPPPPTGVNLNIDTMVLSNFFISHSNDSMTVGWDTINAETYSVVIKNIAK